MYPNTHEDQQRDWRVGRLMIALQVLAAPFEKQIEHFPDFVVVADEVALGFGDWYQIVLMRKDLDLTPAQSKTLQHIDIRLHSIVGWSLDDLREADEWRLMRLLARNALLELGWPLEDPPPNPDHYIPAG